MERKTIMFDASKTQNKTTREILESVYAALEERGYNGIDQMVGYILSGDPSYITSHNNARLMISRIDRDALVEEILKAYLKK
ncbi:MAG: IreB family regulatory phosphoprotein [Eubacterium sp.]|nr:IreB family regulatory phosphoprotein [Eubacterium sp.]